MKILKADTPEQYIELLPLERKPVIRRLRKAILDNLPIGFAEIVSYGMIGYVVPHAVYPPGYHANPELPLPFIHIASQKNHIAFYHMGIYGSPELQRWFLLEYDKTFHSKPDMGKGCIRFKKIDQMLIKLLGELSSKMSVEDWIRMYEANRNRK
jgi:hypothetical protein